VASILNMGYKAGGVVRRCVGKDEKRVESFAVYAPAAIAAIRSLNAVTEDQAIPLVPQRARPGPALASCG
jgi:hypothetical protein